MMPMYDIWRMDAKNELESHNARKQALVNIPSRIAELESAMAAIRSSTSDGTPVRGGGSGREDMLLNNITARQQLEKSLVRTKEAVARVDRALSVLTEDDRRILELCYIYRERGAIVRLANEFCVEEKTISNRRNDALRRFQKAMSGDT
jgi:DNA-directed RNA polymerase specialized sigma24 family protein